MWSKIRMFVTVLAFCILGLCIFFFAIERSEAQGFCTDSDGRAQMGVCTVSRSLKTDSIVRGDTVHDNDDAATVKFVDVDITGQDSDAVIAKVASKKFKVLGYVICCNGAGKITFEDEDGTDTTGDINLVANGDLCVVAPASPIGWFETPTANKALHILKGANVDCDGHITYIEVD